MMNLINTSIAIMGGAGKAGRPLVQTALQAGYHVRALLRYPEKLPLRHERLSIVAGDARDPAALRQLLLGSTALLSTIGHPRGEDTPIVTAVTEHLLTLLNELGITRYVTVTTLYDTGEPQLDPNTQVAADYMQQHFPSFMADRRSELALLAASNLAWTYVRLPLIVEGPPTNAIRTSLTHLPGPRITAEDLARFLLNQLSSDAFVRLAPFVANE